jgi:hypothetical protein
VDHLGASSLATPDALKMNRYVNQLEMKTIIAITLSLELLLIAITAPNNLIAQTMNITTVFHNNNNETKAIIKNSFD